MKPIAFSPIEKPPYGPPPWQADAEPPPGPVQVLVEFVERGLAIRNTFMQDNEPIRIRTDRAAWVKAVEEYLSRNLEKVHLVKFKAARGDGLYPVNRSAEGGGLWADLGGKIDVLNKIIDEIRSKTT